MNDILNLIEKYSSTLNEDKMVDNFVSSYMKLDKIFSDILNIVKKFDPQNKTVSKKYLDNVKKIKHDTFNLMLDIEDGMKKEM